MNENEMRRRVEDAARRTPSLIDKDERPPDMATGKAFEQRLGAVEATTPRPATEAAAPPLSGPAPSSAGGGKATIGPTARTAMGLGTPQSVADNQRPATSPSLAVGHQVEDFSGPDAIAWLKSIWNEPRLAQSHRPHIAPSALKFLAAAGLAFPGDPARAAENATALAVAVSAVTAGIVDARSADETFALDLHVVVAGASCGLGRPVLRLSQACDAVRQEIYASRLRLFERQLRFHTAEAALREAEGQAPHGAPPIPPIAPGPLACMSAERRDIERALVATPPEGGVLLYTSKSAPSLGLPVRPGRIPYAVEAVEASSMGEPLAGRVVRISTIGLASLSDLHVWAESDVAAPPGTIFLPGRGSEALPDMPPAAACAMQRIASLSRPVNLHIPEDAPTSSGGLSERNLAEALAKQFGEARPTGALLGFPASLKGLRDRFACICHLLAWACDNASAPVPPAEVSAEALAAGSKWAATAMAYTLALLADAVAAPDIRRQRLVERTVNEPRFDGTFTLSTLSNRLRPLLDGATVRLAVERLLELGVLESLDTERKPGRPPMVLRRTRPTS